mmetsp:Transcript_19215/g.31451  ORF Transcript_19215/g.31451 Transcript_19215/m.31451 type:complete len:437 (-) Transcript_19215:413-1723(-)
MSKRARNSAPESAKKCHRAVSETENDIGETSAQTSLLPLHAAQTQGNSEKYVIHSLPDSILEDMFRLLLDDYPEEREDDYDFPRHTPRKTHHRALGLSPKVVFLVLCLGHVSRRFRRVVYMGPLWSAIDLSSIWRWEYSPLINTVVKLSEVSRSILSQLDTSKVNFSDAYFYLPLETAHKYSKRDICFFFDKFGPHIREFDMIFSRSVSLRKKIEYDQVLEVLCRCRNVTKLALSIDRLPIGYISLLRSLPLKSLILKLRSVDVVQEALQTIIRYWPNLETLDLGVEDSFNLPVYAEVQTTSLLPLAALSSLHTLTIFQGEYTCVGLLDIHKILEHQHMVSLRLVCVNIYEQGYFLISNNPHLEYLEIEQSTMKKIVVKTCSALREVVIRPKSDKLVSVMIIDCPQIQYLRIHNGKKSLSVLGIFNCPMLKVLDKS